MRPQINLAKLPYIKVNLPSEHCASQIAKRSILIKDVIDVISESRTVDSITDNIDQGKLSEIVNEKFMFKIEGLGRSIQRKEQVKIINSFDGTGLLEENVELV